MMNEAAQTLEGWYALHDFRSIDWAAWQQLTAAERKEGVTLFAEEALHIKKLIYEMRFDEVSARYAEFGEFYIGCLLDEERLDKLLTV